jgi:hypothetical protein
MQRWLDDERGGFDLGGKDLLYKGLPNPPGRLDHKQTPSTKLPSNPVFVQPLASHLWTVRPSCNDTNGYSTTKDPELLHRTHQFAVMFRTALTTGIVLAACTQHVVAVDKTRDPAKVAGLVTSATQLDRQALLPTDGDWLFDFNVQQPYYNFAPGGVVNGP